MQIYIYRYIYIHVHTYIYICIHVYVYVYLYIYVYVHVCIQEEYNYKFHALFCVVPVLSFVTLRLQCVAVCCSVLQCVAVCCSVRCSVLHLPCSACSLLRYSQKTKTKKDTQLRDKTNIQVHKYRKGNFVNASTTCIKEILWLHERALHTMNFYDTINT